MTIMYYDTLFVFRDRSMSLTKLSQSMKLG
jgi:hypothetical protein